MLMELPHDMLAVVLAHLPMPGAANLLRTTRDRSLRTLLLDCMLRARCAAHIQRHARGRLTRNANPAATFVALVYRAARTLLRRVQDGQTQQGTPVCYGPLWVVNFHVAENLMLFVPAAPSAREDEWPDHDLWAALSVTCLEIHSLDGVHCHSPAEMVKVALEHPGFLEELRQLATSPDAACDLHTPSDGIAFW